jgi:hypothetical protein
MARYLVTSIFQVRKLISPRHGVWVPNAPALCFSLLLLWSPPSALVQKRRVRLGSMPLHKCTLNVWAPHVATLHLPPPDDQRLLLELTTTTGPFLARLPPDVPFAAAHNASVHVFTLHHDPATDRVRWQPACFVVHNQTLMQYVDAYREEAGAADVPWEKWGPHGT